MKSIKKAFLELLYPKSNKCCICGREAREAVCSTCLGALEFLEGRVCLKCGKGIGDEYSKNICPDCETEKRYFELAFSCFEYKDMGKTIIHKLKYENCREVSKILARLMKQKLAEENSCFDAIVPVPIHSSKEAVRGFNQAQLIALEIADGFGVPVWDCITRAKATADQFKLDRVQRIVNVHNAFSMNLLYNDVKYDTVLLIDDVFTTGSTANECSRILKEHGVQKVFVATAATGSNT